jgi:hypothetical protein
MIARLEQNLPCSSKANDTLDILRQTLLFSFSAGNLQLDVILEVFEAEAQGP